MCNIGHFWVLTDIERTFYIGGMETHNRRCSAVNKNGKVCKAWSVWDSNPPRCSAHAGRNVGAGAPKGNTNALKHGLYRSTMTAEEIDLLESCDEQSLQSELEMARLQVIRLAGYQLQEDVPFMQKVKMVPVIISAIRAIAYLKRQIAEMEDPIDWDDLLDEVGEAMDWDI